MWCVLRNARPGHGIYYCYSMDSRVWDWWLSEIWGLLLLSRWLFWEFVGLWDGRTAATDTGAEVPRSLGEPDEDRDFHSHRKFKFRVARRQRAFPFWEVGMPLASVIGSGGGGGEEGQCASRGVAPSVGKMRASHDGASRRKGCVRCFF